MAAPEAETVAAIRRALDTIGDPCSVAQGTPMGLDEMGLVEAVELGPDGHVEIRLRLTSPSCMMGGFFKVEAERALASIPEVESIGVSSDLGLDWTPAMMSASARRRRRRALLARFGEDSKAGAALVAGS